MCNTLQIVNVHCHDTNSDHSTIPYSRVDMLHIDAEGYDGHIIHGALDAKEEEIPPVAIFFETKVILIVLVLSRSWYSWIVFVQDFVTCVHTHTRTHT